MEVKRTKTPEQALRMLMYRCAKSEVAVSDARRSLVRWGVAEADRQRIVEKPNLPIRCCAKGLLTNGATPRPMSGKRPV